MEGLGRISSLVAAGLLVASALATGGCSPPGVKWAKKLFHREEATPYDAVMLCRTKVLLMQDGTPVPGVVAQVYLVGGPEFVPIPAPTGKFRFVAYDARQPSQPLQKWEFAPEETPRHRIDHSLGPCYAFWLPVNVPAGMRLPLVLQCAFETSTGQVVSSPVKLILPGAVEAPVAGLPQRAASPQQQAVAAAE